MGEFAAAAGLFSVGHCQLLFCPGRGGMRFRPDNLKGKPIRKQERICHAEAVLKSKKTQHREPLTFYFRYTTDPPFNESPAASFAQYLEDEHRVFKAVFPDISKTQINELEDWRIHMPAMQVLFLSVYLALYVKLRCKSMREDYPPHVPRHISKILELDITRWEIVGPAEYEPSDFNQGHKTSSKTHSI